MDQDETWHAGRTRPLTHCVRWGPSEFDSFGAHCVKVVEDIPKLSTTEM